jgi:uncharacterized protein (TIGR02597 family)
MAIGTDAFETVAPLPPPPAPLFCPSVFVVSAHCKNLAAEAFLSFAKAGLHYSFARCLNHTAMATYIPSKIFIKNRVFPCFPVRNFLRSASLNQPPQMRRFIPLLVALAIAAFPGLTNAQSVTTIPVGFTSTAITPAVDSTSPKGTVVSVPFYAVADFVGAVGSVDSASALSISGAAFTVNQFTSTPHLARMKSGASPGRFFVITANTATQLTLDTTAAGYTLTTGAPGNTQAQVVAGDSVEILPANTLGALFGTSSVPFQTGSVNSADNVYVWNKTNQNFDVFFHDGTNWRKSGSGLNQNDFVILPDQGLFILRRATAPLNLTFLGTVPSTTERTDFVGPTSSFESNRFPVDFTLAGATNPLNLQNLPNWLSGSVNSADNVYVWNNTNQNWDVYFYNSTNWRKSGSGLNQNSTVIPLGTAMFILRRSSAAGNQSTLVQALPYSL